MDQLRSAAHGSEEVTMALPCLRWAKLHGKCHKCSWYNSSYTEDTAASGGPSGFVGRSSLHIGHINTVAETTCQLHLRLLFMAPSSECFGIQDSPILRHWLCHTTRQAAGIKHNTWAKKRKVFCFMLKSTNIILLIQKGNVLSEAWKHSWSEPWGQLMGWNLSTALEWNQMFFFTKLKEKKSLHFWLKQQQANTWTKDFTKKLSD